MDPFIGGALVSAGASLIGGLLDRKDARSAAGRNMQQMIRTGAKYGLHPSTSIGANIPAYSPAFGGALSEAGSAIQRGLSAREEAALQRENMAKQNELIDAQILESTSRTMLNNANTRRTAMAPGSTVDPFAMRKENALIEVKLENGDRVVIPNPDVYENSPVQLATGRALIEAARVTQSGALEKGFITSEGKFVPDKSAGRGAGDFNEYDPASAKYGVKATNVMR